MHGFCKVWIGVTIRGYNCIREPANGLGGGEEDMWLGVASTGKSAGPYC